MLEDIADISASLKLNKNSERVFQPEDFVVVHCLDDVHWNRKLIMEERCNQGWMVVGVCRDGVNPRVLLAASSTGDMLLSLQDDGDGE